MSDVGVAISVITELSAFLIYQLKFSQLSSNISNTRDSVASGLTKFEVFG